MDILGFLASIIIGVSLGLIGAGGSILTVPMLVYLFSVDAAVATVYSLFVVGVTSVAGSFSYIKNGKVNLSTAIFFGIPSVMAVFFTRKFIVPAIPQNIITIGNFTLSKNALLMLIFAGLMLWASYKMIKKCTHCNESETQPQGFNIKLVLFQGILVGFVTGLIGAGGGFLIIPALVNMLKLPMKTAVGTSLVIIAFNSLSGFAFSLEHFEIAWPLLIKVTMVAIVGIWIGSFLSTKIDGKKLKPAFGWLVLLMGFYIICKEVFIS